MRNLSIRSKLAIAFFIIAFFPLMALGFVLFNDVKSEMLSSTEENILSIVHSKMGEIEAFNMHNLENLIFMSQMPHMDRDAEKLLNGEGMEEAKEEMRAIFQEAKLSYKGIEAVFFLHPESGEVLCSSTLGYEGMFFNKRPYFELGKKGPLIYRIHYSHSLEKNILAFAAPVVSDEKLLGVITVWISTDELNQIVKVSPSINTYLVSRSNLHLIGTDSGDNVSFRSGIFTVGATRALAGETGSGKYKDYKGNDVVGAYSLIESLDIALIAEIPMADILENANRKGVRYLIITSVLALVVLLIAFVIGNHITNPIMYLTRAIKKRGESEIEEDIAVPESGLEVTELTNAFNKMIARRNISEKELKLFQSLINQSNDAIFVIDTETSRFLNVNEKACTNLGYSRDELLKMGVIDIEAILPDNFSWEKHMEEVRKTGYMILEGMHKRKDGSTYQAEINANLVHIGDTMYMVSVARDITERKKVEEQIMRLNKDLAAKNRELEQVLYVTSHDLRSPLVNVEGFSRELDISLNELLTALKKMEIPPDMQDKIRPVVEKDIPESLKYIHSSINKMDALLAGLLKISRIGRIELNKTHLDMNMLMGEILETFEFRLKEADIKLEMSEIRPCMGDENLVNQVFSNLIDNAIKYLDPDRSGIITISGYMDGEQSIYCVEDNGIGIAADHLEKIFEIFYQLEPEEGKGEGLGLTTIHKILDMLDGKIWVESEYGRGSKFFVSLPA